MKAGQRARYAERIERAIDLLERQVSDGVSPSLAELAAAAAMSEYHFHRVFRAMTGETVGSAVGRARLGGSLPALDQGILSATERSGYNTSQAYARALRDAVGATPTDLRNNAGEREAAAAALARPSMTNEDRMFPLTITVTSFAPLKLTAIRNVGDYAELNAGFGHLFELVMERLDPDHVTGLYGIPHDDPRDTPATDCRFDCAVTTAIQTSSSGDLATIDIPAGLALKMEHAGDYDLIHSAIDGLYMEAIRSDLPLGDGPLFIHYLHDPDESPTEDLRAEVYLPLES